MEFTVFYAWQSDRLQQTNRYLVRNAAKAAIQRLGKDAEIDDSPRLDHDTKDVSGLPEVAGTIFRKIEGCALFLADLTFVGYSMPRDGKESQLLPSANVVLELGYAARCVGWERVIAVMNTAYGPASQMIFDVLHRRWPIEFNIGEHEISRISEVEKNLSTKIEQWIRSAMNSELVTAKEAIKALDHTCFAFLWKEGNKERFQWPATDRMAKFTYEQETQAIHRLLDLRLLEASFEPTEHFSAYQWTHLGKVVISELRPIIKELQELQAKEEGKCGHCRGTGSSAQHCFDCRGAGYFKGVMCKKCDGSGEAKQQCEYCDGTGHKPKPEAVG